MGVGSTEAKLFGRLCSSELVRAFGCMFVGAWRFRRGCDWLLLLGLFGFLSLDLSHC